MHIGVGLPTGVPGTNGRLVIEWAHRADEGPFSSLGVVDRLAYDRNNSPRCVPCGKTVKSARQRLVPMARSCW